MRLCVKPNWKSDSRQPHISATLYEARATNRLCIIPYILTSRAKRFLNLSKSYLLQKHFY